MLGPIDRSVERPLCAENFEGIEFRVRLGSQILGRSKQLVLDIPSAGVGVKVKRGVKQELALPLKQNLLVSFQDCQKESVTV